MNDHKDDAKLIKEAEAAIGENLVWLHDKLDIDVRQNNADTIRRLKQITDAWTQLAIWTGDAKVIQGHVVRQPRTNRMAIVLEGGLVQGVISDDPALRTVKVFVVDYDTDGAEEELLTLLNIKQQDIDGAFEAKAIIGMATVEDTAIDLAAIEAFYDEQMAEPASKE